MDGRLEHLAPFAATFDPARADDLAPGVVEWIGWRGEWQASWLIQEGPYEGDWHCMTLPGQEGPPPDVFVWAPSSDLTDIDARVSPPG